MHAHPCAGKLDLGANIIKHLTVESPCLKELLFKQPNYPILATQHRLSFLYKLFNQPHNCSMPVTLIVTDVVAAVGCIK